MAALCLSAPSLLPSARRPARGCASQKLSSRFLCSGLPGLRGALQNRLRSVTVEQNLLRSRSRKSLLHARTRTLSVRAAAYSGGAQQYGASAQNFIDEDPEEAKKREVVSKRLESTARYFRRLGALGFWSQLICSIVAAVILAFSVVVSGTATAPVTTYLTCAGIAAAFLSTFWSYGYMRLANRLQALLNNPSKAPPRASVISNLKSGLIINLLGGGAALLGLQATVGVLVGKALTSSYTPFSPGAPPGYSPVLALDVFLIQASGNTLLSHFIGLAFTLELLRALTLQQPPPGNVIPKPA